MRFNQIVFKHLAAILLCLPFVSTHAFETTVVGNSDGDTITVLDSLKTQHKIQLAGIDAPEKGQTLEINPKSIYLIWCIKSRQNP